MKNKVIAMKEKEKLPTDWTNVRFGPGGVPVVDTPQDLLHLAKGGKPSNENKQQPGVKPGGVVGGKASNHNEMKPVEARKTPYAPDFDPSGDTNFWPDGTIIRGSLHKGSSKGSSNKEFFTELDSLLGFDPNNPGNRTRVVNRPEDIIVGKKPSNENDMRLGNH